MGITENFQSIRNNIWFAYELNCSIEGDTYALVTLETNGFLNAYM